MNTILPKEQYNVLWRTSWLSFLTGIYALYKGHYYVAHIPLGVWLTSINYWRYPNYSWSRYIDMTYVNYALISQITYARGKNKEFEHNMVMAFAIGFYPIGIYFYKKKYYWISTICQAQIHIFANIANYILYSNL